MDTTTILSFITFALIAGFTPGPNNVMLAASGANFGFQKTLPHILGVFVGFCALLLSAGFGLSKLFTIMPWLYDSLKIVSFVFLLYLAWKIGSAGSPKDHKNTKPISFMQAASFQLVNPKGIMVIISSVAAYTSSAEKVGTEVFILFIVFAIITIGSTCTWTLLGKGISKLLTSQKQLRQFNVVMAMLLLISLLPAIIGQHNLLPLP